MDDLTARLIAVVLLVLTTGALALLAARALGAWYLRRHPEPYHRPPISPATEHALLGRDNDETQDIVVTNTSSYISGRPLYAQPRGVETRPRS